MRLVVASVAGMCLVVPASVLADSPVAPDAKIFGISEPNTVGEPGTYPSPDGVASLLSDLGAQSHRWVLSWQMVEPRAPQNGVHNYNFAATDRLYTADVAHGIKPLIVLMDAPAWAWGNEVPRTGQPYGMPPGEDHLDDWADFAAAAARRYPQALGFEIWNEPDAWNFWGRGTLPIDPVAYTHLLASAHDAIKSASPRTPVIGGAIAPYPTTVAGVHLSVSDFVGAMLRAGAASYMDGISLHPYASGPGAVDASTYAGPVNWLRNTLSRYGANTPIWITESGISTTGSNAASEQGQAQSLLSLYHWFQAQPDVKALFIHSLFERWTDASSREVGFGLIHQGPTLQPKPAFYALQQATGGAPETPQPAPAPRPAASPQPAPAPAAGPATVGKAPGRVTRPHRKRHRRHEGGPQSRRRAAA
jgi:hypothetical protein